MLKKLLVATLLVISTVNTACYAEESTDVQQTTAEVKEISVEYEKAIANALKNAPIKPEVVKLAITAYDKAKKKGYGDNDILTIIDFSLPSSEKRMWVVDLSAEKLLFHTFVAHGQNSGDLNANSFSNKVGSHQSSLGMYQTAETYNGKHGYSLRLQGLEAGFNSNAYKRAIVVHGADYVSQSTVNLIGRLGRSWGCPAIPSNLVKPVINTIKDGSLVFAYYPDQKWLSQSTFL